MIMKLHHDIFRLGLPELGVAEVYHKILAQYGREVENVNKVYSKQKTDPPLNNNYPPIAGKITWARILFKRINVPIWELQVCSQRKISMFPKGSIPLLILYSSQPYEYRKSSNCLENSPFHCQRTLRF